MCSQIPYCRFQIPYFMLQMFDIRFLISNNEFQMPEFRIHLAECWFSGLRFQIPDCVFSYSPGHICDYQFWRYYFMYQILEFRHEIGQPGNKLNFLFFFRPPSPLPNFKVDLCLSGTALRERCPTLGRRASSQHCFLGRGGGFAPLFGRRVQIPPGSEIRNPVSGIGNRESGNGNRESGIRILPL